MNDCLQDFKNIVGDKYVLTHPRKMRPYQSGYRAGGGKVEAVVKPANLLEFWRILKACVAHDKIILIQAANTGLTGGSTPDGDHYDRDIILINTLRIDRIDLISGGKQAICFAGSTLYHLEKILKPLKREPHSVIGSSCIGASVIGGVCNNSGGALIHRGPAYTEMALYAKIDSNGTLQLVNNLGIDLGSKPEEILECLQRKSYGPKDITYDKPASDKNYISYVRDIEASTPARYNADPRCLKETSGSAGKVAVFAVRMDTYEQTESRHTFYIGTQNPSQLTHLRHAVLSRFTHLPIMGEYIHKDAYDLAEKYGKDIFLIIQYLGTDFLPLFFKLKGQLDNICEKYGMKNFADKTLQFLSRLFPRHLPKRMQLFRRKFDHHLILEVGGQDAYSQMHDYLSTHFTDDTAGWFECAPKEARKAKLHRFAVASAGVRYMAMHNNKAEDLLALDIALPRNTVEWFETLPDEVEIAIEKKLYYGHFFCHVFHQDYVIKKGYESEDIKEKLLSLLDERGAEYPAEHNVGHQYKAKPALEDFYKELDPTNRFNPGIGQTSKKKNWV